MTLFNFKLIFSNALEDKKLDSSTQNQPLLMPPSSVINQPQRFMTPPFMQGLPPGGLLEISITYI